MVLLVAADAIAIRRLQISSGKQLFKPPKRHSMEKLTYEIGQTRQSLVPLRRQ